MILGVILLWIIIYVIGRLTLSYFIHKDDSEVKLEFSEFIDMYSAAPDKYDIGERYTTYEIYYEETDDDDYCDDDWDEIRIGFSFLDYIQYRIWFNQINKQQKAKRIAEEADERSKRKKEFLSHVSNDMKHLNMNEKEE
jgi:hypothetical protein